MLSTGCAYEHNEFQSPNPLFVALIYEEPFYDNAARELRTHFQGIEGNIEDTCDAESQRLSRVALPVTSNLN